jgi:hypothetical protein
MINKELCSEVWTVRRSSSDTLGTEHWIMQDTDDLLAHHPSLDPRAYTDDNYGVEFEENVVQERVSYPTHLETYLDHILILKHIFILNCHLSHRDND